jgi:hypothetical protein
MPVPVVIKETEKKNKDEDFDVKSIKIESESKAIIEALNPQAAAGIKKVLDWCIANSRRDGGVNKLNFSLMQPQNWLKKQTSTLIMEGDLSAGFFYLCGNFISESMQKSLFENLSKFCENSPETLSRHPY